MGPFHPGLSDGKPKKGRMTEYSDRSIIASKVSLLASRRRISVTKRQKYDDISRVGKCPAHRYVDLGSVMIRGTSTY